ncbi:MAG: hypothetical protein AAFU85_29060 [Planctomycetota bacterium]
MNLSLLRNLVFLCPLAMIIGCNDSPKVSQAGSVETKASSSGETTFTFPNGPVTVSIPVSGTVRLEAGDTVVVSPPSDSSITLRFNLHGLPGLDAEEFLLAQSKSKGLEITRIGGKASLSEMGTRSEGDIQYDMTFWQIAFGDSLVVMSAEVESDRASDPVVKEFIAAIPEIIESMAKE